jgi:predicted enzyme related to lactoylglutathione lyase
MGDRPVHFEIHCPDMATAKKFYEEVFGWKISKWEGPMEYYVVSTGDPGSRGIDGGMMPSRDGQPRTVNTLQVQNVDDAVRRAVAAAGKNVLPKKASPGVGWLAYCTDPGGNIFGVMNPDASSK